MSGSVAERAIRDAVVDFLHRELPDARVIHELVVETCRADIAAVQRERIMLIEIKSARDTLKRLPRQTKLFERASHQTVIVADERWFEDTTYGDGRPLFRAGEALRDGVGGYGGADLWCFPPDRANASDYRWKLPMWRAAQPEPHAARLLSLLWKQELLAEASRHRVSAGSRSTISTLIRDMAWHMAGGEIARAVCRQLRMRHFPEADAPIFERAAA